MRVASYRRYGGPEVIEIVERPTPEPARGEILVRVAAASVGASDSAGRLGKPAFARLFFGPFCPRNQVLGSDYVGEVVGLGAGVTNLAVGDRVYGATTTALGSHAECVVVPAEGAVTTLVASVSDEHAVALTDGALTALHFLRDAGRVHRANGCSLTARPARWGPPESSSRSTSVRTSRRSRALPTLSWCVGTEPTR